MFCEWFVLIRPVDQHSFDGTCCFYWLKCPLKLVKEVYLLFGRCLDEIL